MGLTEVTAGSVDPAVHSPGTCVTSCGCQPALVGAGAHHLIPCPEKASNISFKNADIKRKKTRNCVKAAERRRRRNEDPADGLRQPGFAGRSPQDERDLICGQSVRLGLRHTGSSLGTGCRRAGSSHSVLGGPLQSRDNKVPLHSPPAGIGWEEAEL